MFRFSLKAVLLISCVSAPALAQDGGVSIPAAKEKYSPYLEQDFPNQVFFGDTHLHTVYSADAGLAYVTLDPDAAYRFAKGEEVTSSMNVPGRLNRPLDWLVVSDHAENLGLPLAMEANDPLLQDTEWGRELMRLYEPRTFEARHASYFHWQDAVNAPGGPDPLGNSTLNQTYWKLMTEASERHNQPGTFTALNGFEWTSMPGGNNLHRVVIFRDGKEKADTIVPISQYDTEDPEELWEWMSAYENDTGGQVLAIPHNPNVANGLMFDDVTLGGDPLTQDYAERRMRWEPLLEVTQIKGDSEAHPMLSPDDEFADFGTWDKGNLGSTAVKEPDMIPREYAREALKRGLAFENELGANPFKFGMIGSTDSHTALSTAEESNFFGKMASYEPGENAKRYTEVAVGVRTETTEDDITMGEAVASGLAAVWARENTREAIWDALKRKEVYATTGTRIRVRVFGGFDFKDSDLPRSDFAAHGYANGVPMGGDLTAAPDGKAPGFLIRALRIRTEQIWIACRSSKAGSITTAPHQREYMMLHGRMNDSSVRMKNFNQSVTPSIWKTPPGLTISAVRSSQRSGKIPNSNQHKALSIMCAFWKYLPRVGRSTTGKSLESICLKAYRQPSRSAPIRLQFGIRRNKQNNGTETVDGGRGTIKIVSGKIGYASLYCCAFKLCNLLSSGGSRISGKPRPVERTVSRFSLLALRGSQLPRDTALGGHSCAYIFVVRCRRIWKPHPPARSV